MKPRRPYLLRAMLEWIADNGWTPHIIVDAHHEGLKGVPVERIVDGRVTLSVSPQACPDFRIEGNWLRGSMRFGGVASVVEIPIAAVLAVFAAESMQGLVFPDDEGNPGDDEPGGATEAGGRARGRPRLKVVK